MQMLNIAKKWHSHMLCILSFVHCQDILTEIKVFSIALYQLLMIADLFAKILL